MSRRCFTLLLAIAPGCTHDDPPPVTSAAGELEVDDATIDGETFADEVSLDVEVPAAEARQLFKPRWLPPVTGGRLTSRFGDLDDAHGSPHDGLDIAVPMGTEIVAPTDVHISYVGLSTSAGRFIIADARDDGESYRFTFAHLSHVDVFEGADVARGEPLGLTGISGAVTGPHLHFRVERVVGDKRDAMNPLGLIPAPAFVAAAASP